MKKLLIAFVVALASFSSAFAAKYDFTSGEAFEKSIEAQAKVEGLTEEQLAEGFELYTAKLLLTNMEAVEAVSEKGEEAMETLLLKLFAENMGEKPLKELFKGLEEEVKKLVEKLEAEAAAE